MSGADMYGVFKSANDDDLYIEPAKLFSKVERVFLKLGVQKDQAVLIADHLVMANVKGHDSHGISLIPLYVDTALRKAIRPCAEPKLVHDGGVILNVDGQKGFGQVAAYRAMEWAIARAQTQGCVLVGLRNSHHIGRVGHYAEQCAKAGLASVHFVNVVQSPPVVAPYAGSDARLHTNPVAIGIPRAQGEGPVILDFATSRVAQGKMRIAMNRGQSVPSGYLLDDKGAPSQDPSVVYNIPLGALLPFGEHKGSGLGLICDLLAGAMTGGGAMHEGNLGEKVYINNAFSVVFDPDRINPDGEWQAEMEAGLAYFAASPPRDANYPILLPGDTESCTSAARQAEGIPVDRITWGKVAEAAARLDISF